MHVIARKPLNDFAAIHTDAASPLRAWWKSMKRGRFTSPHELKEAFPAVSIVGDELTVFNIGGGKYRLVAFVVYRAGLVYVDGVYTHADYDRMVSIGLLGTRF